MGLFLRVHFFSEQFSRPSNRRQRTLNLMGERMDVLLHILFPFQGFSHLLKGLSHLPNLTSIEPWKRTSPPFPDIIRIPCQSSDRLRDPHRNKKTEESCCGAENPKYPQESGSRTL